MVETVPINLAGKTYNIKVYKVPSRVPFLVRGKTLHVIKGKIHLAPNIMEIGNRTIQLALTNSGHINIPWTSKTHKQTSLTLVLMKERVSRK